MSSIGHVAVGTAVGSPGYKSMLFYAGLALLPDIDVIGLPLGVAYPTQWGHRGFTHSFAFALVAAAIVGVIAKSRKAFVLAALAILSHGILDAMTDGGLGPALLWPFTKQRFFLPWTPIPVAPIGVPGIYFLIYEAILFTPFWLIALVRWMRRDR